MKALRVTQKSASPEELSIQCSDIETPGLEAGHCLIEIASSGVNPSDGKGVLGKMPNLAWPRTPGRDYSGTVVEGPSHLIGKEVWGGGGGDLGMSRDGAHAQFMSVEEGAVREKPEGISLIEAGGIGVPFTCAYLGLVDGAGVADGETVCVLGANGKVGEAAIQIAAMHGARVLGLERSGGTYRGHSCAPVEIIDGSAGDGAEAIMERTEGKGADIILIWLVHVWPRRAARSSFPPLSKACPSTCTDSTGAITG